MSREGLHNTPEIRAMEGYLTKIARAMSRNWGVDVEFTGTDCKTDGKSIIYLPYNSDYLVGDAKLLIHSNLDHEVCHVSEEQKAIKEGRTTPITLMAKAGKPSLKLLMNVFEDIRIERVYSREFPGMSENLRAGSRHSIDLFKARHARGDAGSNFWHYLACGIIAKSQAWDDLSWIPAEINDWLDLLQPEIDDSRKAETPEEAAELAKRVHEKTLAKAHEVKEHGVRIDGKTSVEPPCWRPEDEPAITDMMDFVKDEITKASKDDITRHKRYVPDPALKAMDRWVKPGNPDSMGDYNQALEEVRSQIGALRSRTLSFVRVMAQSRTVGDQADGALDAASLHTLKLGNKDVFSKEVPGQVMNAAISVLIDLSGSMGSKSIPNEKAWYAHRVSIALAETFEQLQVPCEFIGFTNNWSRYPRDYREPVGGTYQCRSPFDYYIFKDFGESLRKTRHRFQYITGMCDNADGEAVWETAKRLARRTEIRKILIVISDGYPACSGCENLDDHLKQVVKQITDAGIEVFGIGVVTPAVKTFYNASTGAEHIIIHNLETMASQVYTAMRKKLLRRAA